MPDDESGVSVMVGTILLISITVMFATLVTSFMMTVKIPEDEPVTSLEVTAKIVDNENVKIIVHHMGGESIPVADLSIWATDHLGNVILLGNWGHEILSGGESMRSTFKFSDLILPGNRTSVKVLHEPSRRLMLLAPGVSITGVEPTLGVSLEIKPKYQSGKPGENLTFKVTVTNEGNLEDTYTIFRNNIYDWQMSMVEKVTVLARSSVTEDLTIIVGDEIWYTNLINLINLTAESKYDPAVQGVDMASVLLGWQYRKKITIDCSKISNDLDNFPVLVKLDGSNFDWTHALDNGDDIRFTDGNCSTEYKYERERHDSSNGYAEYWVKIPSISSTKNTVFYIYYGNSSASDGSDPMNVWDDNFMMVQHMKDNTASTIEDSTANNNDGTKKAANEPIENVGKIDNAQSFDGVDDYVDCGDKPVFEFSGDFSVETWVKHSVDTDQVYVCKWTGSGLGSQWWLGFNLQKAYFGVCTSSGAKLTSGTNIADGQWHHVVGRRSGTTIYIYQDGVLKGSTTDSTGDAGVNDAPLTIGKRGDATWWFNGTIDEVRISNIARSEAWIKASYHSGNDNLLSYGSEETLYVSH